VAVVMICMFGQYTWRVRGYFDEVKSLSFGLVAMLRGMGLDLGGFRSRAAVSHISRKTSEIWGTPCFLVRTELLLVKDRALVKDRDPSIPSEAEW
jgi:hypothetical protein